MGPGMLLRIFMIVTGVFLFCVTVSSLAKRKMTEPFCLTWGLISLILIFAGILLRPTEWNRYISGTGLLLVMMIAFCVIFGVYFISTRVSELMRRNQELAIQVSLLKHENEEIAEQLAELVKAVKLAGTSEPAELAGMSESAEPAELAQMTESAEPAELAQTTESANLAGTSGKEPEKETAL